MKVFEFFMSGAPQNDPEGHWPAGRTLRTPVFDVQNSPKHDEDFSTCWSINRTCSTCWSGPKHTEQCFTQQVSLHVVSLLQHNFIVSVFNNKNPSDLQQYTTKMATTVAPESLKDL